MHDGERHVVDHGSVRVSHGVRGGIFGEESSSVESREVESFGEERVFPCPHHIASRVGRSQRASAKDSHASI